MSSQGVGIRPSRPAAGSLDQLRATILIAVSGLALSLPECARAQSDKAQPAKRSVLCGKASVDQDDIEGTGDEYWVRAEDVAVLWAFFPEPVRSYPRST